MNSERNEYACTCEIPAKVGQVSVHFIGVEETNVKSEENFDHAFDILFEAMFEE